MAPVSFLGKYLSGVAARWLSERIPSRAVATVICGPERRLPGSEARTGAQSSRATRRIHTLPRTITRRDCHKTREEAQKLLRLLEAFCGRSKAATIRALRAGGDGHALGPGGNAVGQQNIPAALARVHLQHDARLGRRMVKGLVEEEKIRSHLDHGNAAAVYQQQHFDAGGMSALTRQRLNAHSSFVFTKTHFQCWVSLARQNNLVVSSQ